MFKLSRLKGSELIGFAGAAILIGAMFLPWFSTSCDVHLLPHGCNANSQLNGLRGSFDAFQTYSMLQWWLVAAAAAPFILAYIIARGHELTWRPGEVTMVVGIVAFVLILANGIIFGRPGGDRAVGISLGAGYFVALLGALTIGVGGFIRQAKAIRSRKPPGVL